MINIIERKDIEKELNIKGINIDNINKEDILKEEEIRIYLTFNEKNRLEELIKYLKEIGYENTTKL